MTVGTTQPQRERAIHEHLGKGSGDRTAAAVGGASGAAGGRRRRQHKTELDGDSGLSTVDCHWRGWGISCVSQMGDTLLVSSSFSCARLKH